MFHVVFPCFVLLCCALSHWSLMAHFSLDSFVCFVVFCVGLLCLLLCHVWLRCVGLLCLLLSYVFVLQRTLHIVLLRTPLHGVWRWTSPLKIVYSYDPWVLLVLYSYQACYIKFHLPKHIADSYNSWFYWQQLLLKMQQASILPCMLSFKYCITFLLFANHPWRLCTVTTNGLFSHLKVQQSSTACQLP